jgi:hypothetical protein
VPESTFVGYVGEPDFHDGYILTVDRVDDSVRVRIRGNSGKTYLVMFGSVVQVRANRPEGMLLYALSEFTSEPPIRRFVFANWDDENASVLEVDAERVEVRPE